MKKTVKQIAYAKKISGKNNPAKRPEVRAKISKNNAMKRASVRVSRSGKGNGNNTPIIAISPKGEEYRYDAIREAARSIHFLHKIKLDHRNISKVCQGKRPHHKHWSFRYA